jgi:hypothetical protein
LICGSKAKNILPIQNPTDLIGVVDLGIRNWDARFLFDVLCSFLLVAGKLFAVGVLKVTGRI